MIKHVSLPHGWFYFYRIHEIKRDDVKSHFPDLTDYMDSVFDNCPHEHFLSGPRSSHLKFKVPIPLVEIKGHEVCSWAEKGLSENKRYKSAHSKVQVTMLEEDPKTFAVEIPLWLMPDEISIYKKLFDSDEPLSGHIDLLRFDDNKIWVWDFKPKAHKEQFAHTQTFFYALMLSKRTGIPLDNFRCGYFDENTSFVFKPSEDILKKIKVE